MAARRAGALQGEARQIPRALHSPASGLFHQRRLEANRGDARQAADAGGNGRRLPRRRPACACGPRVDDLRHLAGQRRAGMAGLGAASRCVAGQAAGILIKAVEKLNRLENFLAGCAAEKRLARTCISPLPPDRRFRHSGWQIFPFSAYEQSFLLWQGSALAERCIQSRRPPWHVAAASG